VLDRFFTVLTITPSFLIRFWPVKCRIEALITFFRMVKERSVRFSFRSGQRSGQTLVKLGRIWSKPSKLWEMCPGPYFEGFWTWWTLVGLETARSNLGQTLVNPGQTWSTLVKLGQTSGNVSRTFFLGLFNVASACRIRPAWFGLSRFACRRPRKSRG
jgi:hypothetical protein